MFPKGHNSGFFAIYLQYAGKNEGRGQLGVCTHSSGKERFETESNTTTTDAKDGGSGKKTPTTFQVTLRSPADPSITYVLHIIANLHVQYPCAPLHVFMFVFTVSSVRRATSHTFDAKETDWGFSKFMETQQLESKFVKDDTLSLEVSEA